MEKEDIVTICLLVLWIVLCFAIDCIMIKTIKCKESKTTTINVKQNNNIEYKDGFNSIPKE